MSISIYNSLTRKKEPFEPINPPKVNIYTCGVTVYDDCHIGHARSLYIFDVIRRYLKYRGYEVNFVRNITDIDDKIINKAKEENLPFNEITKRYIDSYYRDIKSLGIEKADSEPKATENIPDMVKYIQGLIDKGFAYVVDGDVYFSVRSFKDYGKLSGQGVDQMLEAVRVEKDPQKKDPLDFALWKKSAEDEPSWDSPSWGKGRPGWHIECSVMSQKFLKTQTLDIHAGGRDLIFPHHENEIAQAEALTGKPFARYWIHHGLLTINGQKMAKSAGNFVTIKDFITKYHNPDLLKLFFLSTHYSNPIDYNQEKVEESKKQKESFDNFFKNVDSWKLKEGRSKTITSETDLTAIDSICIEFEKTMDDDFNTPQALACLFKLIDLASGFISLDKEDAFIAAKSKLEIFFSILGITRTRQTIPDEIERKRKERDDAKKNKDFQKSDEIRKDMGRLGYAVADTAGGTTIIYIHDEKNTPEENEENKR